MSTETMKKTLSPTWDQTLIFGEIEIFGDPKALEASAPEAYIELFDHDTFVWLFSDLLKYSLNKIENKRTKKNKQTTNKYKTQQSKQNKRTHNTKASLENEAFGIYSRYCFMTPWGNFCRPIALSLLVNILLQYHVS